MLTALSNLVMDCVGASDNQDGTFRLDFTDSESRLATDNEIELAQTAYQRSQIKPVSAAQFQAALLSLPSTTGGPDRRLLDDIEDFIATHGDRETKLDWAKRQVYERNHYRIEQMRVLLGKTHADVDTVFVLSATK